LALAQLLALKNLLLAQALVVLQNFKLLLQYPLPVTTIATLHSSTILFSPLDPIVAATQDTSTELTGQNPTAATE
ncbi:MAG: hypothetical protein EBY20_11905, partial [Alphaproteobacteria bacterium]|nr:hypothetical protein [Alphaproteobacteria bacterium]